MKDIIKKSKDKKEKKGFTLIELLAVIVILSVVMIIVIPCIIDTVNNSRIKTLHTSSQAVADWWKRAITSDNLQSANEKKVTGSQANDYLRNHPDEWFCLKDLYNAGNASKDDSDPTKISMFEVADLNVNEVRKDGGPYRDGHAVSSQTCSSIKLTSDNKIVVLLVATPRGKYFVTDKNVTYAFSNEKDGVAN